MTRVTINPTLLAQLHNLAEVLELCDESGHTLGYFHPANTSQGAAEANAKQSNAVLEQLRKLVPAANIRTVNFSVNPNYKYPAEGGPPAVLGYTANNTVRPAVAVVLSVASRGSAPASSSSRKRDTKSSA